MPLSGALAAGGATGTSPARAGQTPGPGRQLGTAVSAVISATRWLPAEELKRNADLYRDCGLLHRRCGLLVVRLRRLLLHIAGTPPAPEHGVPPAPGNTIDIQELTAAVDEVVSVSAALARVRAAVSLAASQVSQANDSSGAGAGTGAGAGGGPGGGLAAGLGAGPGVAGCGAVLAYKLQWWRGRVWQDRVTLLHLVQAIVTETLSHSTQHPDWPGWRNILRMVAVYNEMLGLGSSGDGSVVGVCRNSCATLQHPLRKLSLTRILQLLAQKRAERCCRQLVQGLLASYRPPHLRPHHRHHDPADPDSPGSSRSPPPDEDSSSMEIFRALTHHLSPPHGLTPVASDARCAPPGPAAAATESKLDLERIVRAEDALLGGLLQAAVHHAPHLLGAGAVKNSKTTEEKRARGGVRRRAQQYYQQLLWGEVGCVVEHVLLWWGAGCARRGPLGAEPPDHCHHLRAWLIKLTKSPAVPALCLGALQSLVDSLGVHVTSTSWDALFRRAIVAAGHQHSRSRAPRPGAGSGAARGAAANDVEDEQQEAGRGDVEAGVRGTATGRLFAATLADLVDLSNHCEGDGPASAAPPLDEIEALPLVEQIPLLHRLDHSVHTTRLWTAARARLLASSWTLAAFFLVSQRDVANCLSELSRLKLRDHGDLPRTASVHVTVCSKMRAKLVSEVRENINKLKRVPEESIAVLASVCRTVSLATLHMVFPAAQYWRQSGSGGMPEYATAYVEDFLERVLRPVLAASGLLTASVQLTVGGLVLRIACESWLDHIYTRRIKFSEWGALQLLTDFGAVPTWLCERVSLPTELRAALLRHEVLRRCEGVGRLLLRRPGERVSMSGHSAAPGPSSSVHPALAASTPAGRFGQTGDQGSGGGGGGGGGGGSDTLMPAEMYVPNQEQWLELRAPRGPGDRVRAQAHGLCAATLCCMLPAAAPS
ncbi:Coiled-coil domain-containing protein 142 [Frankliniella fusca]|uniref:Coiled-coil domain-containing protein 142 n=1 Tax=Frankliniella fusca TaxID=407009 RepID=A0AAE1I2F8_9NEOP|nr:Coiled-coil domain-containing protein 142 [Frankliniella fusca]